MSNIKNLLCVISLFFTVVCSLQAADLHVISVADTLSDDIRISIEKDEITLRKQALEISHYTGLALKYHDLSGSQANAVNVLSFVRELETEEGDVVIFQFSGHGYRTPSKGENPWPNIYFSVDQTGLDLLQISEILAGKSAHLSLVIADCCNNVLSDKGAPRLYRAQVLPRRNEDLITANYRKLFLETDGVIIMTGAKAGQYACCSESLGGYFIYSFDTAFNLLAKQLETNRLNWAILFDQAVLQLGKLNTGVTQEPVYSLINK